MKSALVTGAYGFLGRHVSLHLRRAGYDVRGIGHGAWEGDEWNEWGISVWHDLDITFDNLASCAGNPDVVIHCAGSGSVPFSIVHPRQDFERSVLTSLAVLEFQRVYLPNSRVVIPSSAGVYGVVNSMPIRIETPLNPVSPYGTNKKVVEDLSRSYGRQFQLNISIVRLFSIYGIGLRKQLLWDAAGKFARGDTKFHGTGEETRDWLHIADAADLILAMIEVASPDCPVVNGGTGIATTNRRILNQLAEAIGPDLSVQFSGISRSGDPAHYVADISETEPLQWNPKRKLEEEILAYGRWYNGGAI